MKIGLYTIHAADNFGAQLQSFATQFFLEKEGYDVEVVNLLSVEEEKRINYRYSYKTIKGFLLNIYALLSPTVHLKKKRQRQFHERLHLSRRFFSTEDLKKNLPMYDIHLVGSDQVWNVEHGNAMNNPFFLDYLPKDARKIAFASSFGANVINKNDITFVSKALADFDSISCREKEGVDLIEKLVHKRAQHVLDPTFLLTKDEWLKHCLKSSIVRQEYILYYGFSSDDRCREIIETAKKYFKKPVVALSVSLLSPYKVDKFYQEAGPAEFLNLIYNAFFVITGSFHGMALALNFEKDFVVIKHGTRMSRMESLLDRLNIKGRIVEDKSQFKLFIENGWQMDYKTVRSNIQKEAVSSKQWLLKALKEYN